KAQPNALPPATAVAAAMPLTETGLVAEAVVPEPSAPCAPSPQHLMPPLTTVAQLCRLPLGERPVVSVSPTTDTGFAQLSLGPLPRSPASPQHFTTADVSLAQV